MSYLDADGGAVYRIFDEADALIYIGSTGDVRARLRQHRTSGAAATDEAEAVRTRYHRHEVEFYPTLGKARAAEFDAIAAERPELNTNGRGGRQTSDIDTAVRSLAEERGVGMCELAFRADLDVRNLARLLATRQVNTDHLFTICEVLGVNLSDLLVRAEAVAA